MNYPRPSRLEKLPAVDVQPVIPAWKRVLDVSCILLASPILLPVGLLLALAIKIVSPGPVLFKQERVGYRGHRFLCLKFRTMKVNADTRIHQGHLVQLMKSNRPMVKLDAAGDPRLIPGGLTLRTLGLDELPQLINVLRGEMSLVGPRPCIPYEYDQYLPRYRQRCGTLPGLTGLWQVNGKNRTTFEQMMDFDIYYVNHKSLGMDLKILALTIPAIVLQACDLKARRQQRDAAAKPTSPVDEKDQARCLER
jgi:exopolysaccharide production protein ExoY